MILKESPCEYFINFLVFGQLTGNNAFTDRKNTFFTLKWLLEEFSDDSDDDNFALSENGQKMARFACERLHVPRDVGMIPALALGQLVQSSLQ